MKRQIFLRLALLAGLFFAGEEARASSHIKSVSVSGNGARIVFTEDPLGQHPAPIHVYDAYSHRELGQLSCARRLSSASKPDETSDSDSENLLLEDVSSDGRHILATRTLIDDNPPVDMYGVKRSRFHFLEAWDITQTPRLVWRKKSVSFSDVRWVGRRITMLLDHEVQQWDENGNILSRLSLPTSSHAQTLSPDGKLALSSAYPPSIIETRTGRVIQKLGAENFRYDSSFDFTVGRENLYVLVAIFTPDEPLIPWDEYCLWRVSDGKCFPADGRSSIFSPDGSATWDVDARRFRSIETNKLISLDVPPLLAATGAGFKAVSDDGRVWAGLDSDENLVWTTTRKAKD